MAKTKTNEVTNQRDLVDVRASRIAAPAGGPAAKASPKLGSGSAQSASLCPGVPSLVVPPAVPHDVNNPLRLSAVARPVPTALPHRRLSRTRVVQTARGAQTTSQLSPALSCFCFRFSFHRRCRSRARLSPRGLFSVSWLSSRWPRASLTNRCGPFISSQLGSPFPSLLNRIFLFLPYTSVSSNPLTI